MLLERIYDEDLAQASYLLGCQATGEAVVVDARRDIGVYLELAAQHALRIVTVTETHIHADFLSGTRELAHATGAVIHVSDEGGPDWTYGPEFDTPAPAVRLRHGDQIRVGNLTLQAIHTPGHTPEHLSFLLTDGAQTDEPGFMLTGDFVFVGELGRPDLLDAAAGGVDTRFTGAKQLFQSLRERFLPLPDHVIVLPGHGSGSACGASLGAVPMTTVGYERRTAWWAPLLEAGDEEGFTAALLRDQPDAHAYFARMKRQNREGPAVLGTLPALREHSAEDLQAAVDAGSATLLDTRAHHEMHAGTLPGALHVPGLAKAASYGAWAIDPEQQSPPLVLLAADAAAAEALRNSLLRVGIDTAAGWIPSLEGLALNPVPTISPEALPQAERAMLLDLRSTAEHAEGHVPGAVNIPAGSVLWRQAELPGPGDGPIIAYCRSGVRSAVASAALRRAGHDVIELQGSYLGWVAAQGS